MEEMPTPRSSYLKRSREEVEKGKDFKSTKKDKRVGRSKTEKALAKTKSLYVPASRPKKNSQKNTKAL